MLSLLILVYSTVLQFSMPSVVLCFGNDGHIAFEQFEDGYPFVDSDEHGDHLPGSHENLSHQDEECNDILLINLFSIPFLEKESISKNFKLSIANNYFKTTNFNYISHFKVLKKPITMHSSIESLQSIILIIWLNPSIYIQLNHHI